MTTDSITISKEELFKLIKKAIREELHEIEFVSNEEQKELEQLHGKKALFEDDFNPKDCVEY